MRYIKVIWIHEFDNEPVLFYHEIDNDGFEVRKLWIFNDGKAELASEGYESEDIYLSPEIIPTINEINQDTQFIAKEISAEEFESIWIEHV